MKNSIKTLETTLGTLELIGAIDSYKTPVVVEKSVVQRLASLLSSADIWSIKKNFKQKLEGVEYMEEFTALLQEELAFQLSVNQLQKVEVISSEEEREEIDISQMV